MTGRNTTRRGRARLLLLALAVALTGCTGLPTSGEVTAGLVPGAAPEEPDTQFFPLAPTAGATPEQIVTGFIEAALSPVDGWETARLFLSRDLAATWRPEAGVTVDAADARRTQVDEETGLVTLTVAPTATVDEHGTYTTSASGSVDLQFRVAQREDGEWRIVEAPDGIVLDRQNFPVVFNPHPLAYFDPTWRFLVPDVRWFPTSGNTATSIVRELVDGAPSPWLAGSVASAFAQDIDLQTDAVPVDTDQVAHVELNSVAAGADATALGRMLAQLDASLANTGVQSVRLTTGSDTRPVDVEPVPVSQTRPDSRALVLREDEFGFLSGSELTPIDGLSPTLLDIPADIEAISVSPDQQVAAVKLGTGLVSRVTSDGNVDTVDERGGQIEPLIDPFGYVWTVVGRSPGEVTAWNADLEPFAIEGAWPEADAVRAWAMSRDGSRIAALVTTGGQHLAVVASVRRDRSGNPAGLGPAMRVTELAQAGVAVAWIEDARIGVVTSDGETWRVVEQQIGGPAEVSDAPAGTASIAFGTQDSSVRLLTEEGVMYMRRGSSWQQTGADVQVLATQMGTPPRTG
jgi:hypothetical protein